MAKITFMGAGSSIFAKNVLGDCLHCDSLKDSQIALYDIDAGRLEESRQMIELLNKNINDGKATITAYLGVENRQAALKDANFVVNAIQVGGYEPSTVIDFDIPNKYGLRQTIADTIGIGGIFRALRTIPVMWDFARDMEKVCPNAWFLNYTNPMSALTGAMLRYTDVKTVGLCHSVQVCSKSLLETLEMEYDEKTIRDRIAGINHMGWLLEISRDGKDIYPEIKAKAAEKMAEWRAATNKDDKSKNMTRLQMMQNFGYYITESSEHMAEYMPYWIKKQYPGLIDEFNIPLDEYPHRCIKQIEKWGKQSKELLENPCLTHERSHEYGATIMNAILTNEPAQIGGNVLNNGLISNIPNEAVVEVPCLVDANGIQGCYVGALPEQLAALNRTNINVHLLTIEAAITGKKEHIYHAAMLDPHTRAELTLDEIRNMCDEMIEAHGNMMPKFV
ncbi:MAG: alpha-glucosidase/alpha-galactosidase [Victivallaceae bacterium]|nr:alpha-glucosidase/alpha-galactosidase [Victivallaceae bacterium]